MKLYEFEGKRLLKEFGVPVLPGQLVLRDSALPEAPVVLKAQALSGGRGKVGLVQICRDADALSAQAAKLFDAVHEGERITALWAEKPANVRKEYYCSVTYDGETGGPLLVASGSGGVEVERTAAERPDAILKMPFDIFYGPADYQFRQIAAFIDANRVKELTAILRNVYRMWRESGATLVEINPLALTDEGVIALDAKFELDDASEKCHKELFAGLKDEQHKLFGRVFRESGDTMTYVQLDGSVGLISDGAGTGMLALDLMNDEGVAAADFCEMGGLTNADVMYDALDKVLTKNPDVKSVLVVLIGGFNRMDEMAKGIVRYRDEKHPKARLIVRLCGTMEDEGKKIMADAGLDVYNDLLSAVKASRGRHSDVHPD